jgi:hypothetical protein
LCFFACGEGRRRVCDLPQSLWRQLHNNHHHHQGFLSGARVQFLQRMVPDVAIRLDINGEIEMYRDGTGLFGYEDIVASRNILLPRKLLEFRR